jgi:uncharacterized OB-fold protein
MAEAKTEPALTAQHKVAYTYKRSLGPVLSRFFTGLREGKILGIRRADGTVMVPPKEYDPDSGDALDELLEVRDTGVVRTFAWVHHPRAMQPLSRPFAYALIQLDGADTALLHAVDAGSESAMRTGMRVRARWADERVGAITDIACFIPAAGEGHA